MEAQSILELRDIVITALARIVWCMEGNTQVETEDKELQIVAEAYTGTQCNALGKILQGELSSRSSFFLRRSHTLPASRKVAPYKSPKIGKRYSTLASSLISPVWSM